MNVFLNGEGCKKSAPDGTGIYAGFITAQIIKKASRRNKEQKGFPSYRQSGKPSLFAFTSFDEMCYNAHGLFCYGYLMNQAFAAVISKFNAENCGMDFLV